jgi:hypothetical protein
MDNISVNGAAVSSGPPLPTGARGTLEADWIGVPLPFVVRANEDAILHLAFEIDAATTDRLTQTVGQMKLQRAA